MKQKLKFLTIIVIAALFISAMMVVDLSPNMNSFRSTYYGNRTTVLQDFKAHLSNDTNNIFWFIHITDAHIGAYSIASNNRQNLRDLIRNTDFINPSFIVETGDVTNGIIPLPTIQSVEEWRDRYNIFVDEGVNSSFYYDIPGNHDGYGDSSTFSFFLNWSIQKQLQYTWNRTFSFGNYTFIALNSATDTGENWPGGTEGSFNQFELDWFESQLNSSFAYSNLTFVFAHHPESDVGDSETSLTNRTFLELLEKYNVSAYIFGHGHENVERNQGGTICIESDSLGLPSSSPGYRIFAVDNDGIACRYQHLNTWPAVIITCPIDRELTMQAFDIPNNTITAPIRALVFDKVPVTSVAYQIDGGAWVSMSPAPGNPNLWNSSFDASILTETEHTVTVRAISTSGTSSDSITIRIGQHDAPEKINGALPDFKKVKNSEPWVLDLTMYEWDRYDRGTQLNWSISGVDPSLCLVELTNINDDLVTFTPIKDAVGTVDVFFTLNNSRGKQVTGYITITLVDRMDLSTFQVFLGLVMILGVVAAISFNFILMRKSEEKTPGTKKEIKERNIR